MTNVSDYNTELKDNLFYQKKQNQKNKITLGKRYYCLYP